MCGIAGLIRVEGRSVEDILVVERMTSAQIHRGPDADGLYQDGRVVLGHRRLSIIDLSPLARQPMANEDDTVWVTYNGEIYNYPELRKELVSRGHHFRSQSDTEVILHGYEEWGIEGLLAKLRGMFAFGLYDSRRGLILARDRMGIKPLYYFVQEKTGLLIFASEVKALLRSGLAPREYDLDAVAGFLLAGSVPAPLTTIQGVRCLAAGHYLLWQEGRITTRKYWDLTYGPAERTENTADLGELLQDAVSRHLVSDVPVGLFLSGGVDSAALVAIASRSPKTREFPLETLTVAFDEQEFSEARQAREIAARFHTRHHEIRVTSDDFMRELPAILAAMDQPTNDGVNTYFVSQAARHAGLTVVLSGLGGDEVFWGYRHYRWLAGRARWLVRCPAAARRALTVGATTWGQIRGRENWMRMAFLDKRASNPALYLLMRGFFPPQQVMRLLGIGQSQLNAAVEQHFEMSGANGRNGVGADAFNYLEFKRYLHDQLLRDTDTFSMAHSIEVRVPYLDHTIVEHAAHIQPASKIGNGINKPLLVGAVDDPLLLKAGAGKKRGFSFPMDRWMRGHANELQEMAVGTTLLDGGAVRALWRQFDSGRLHWSRAWALSVLGTATK